MWAMFFLLQKKREKERKERKNGKERREQRLVTKDVSTDHHVARFWMSDGHLVDSYERTVACHYYESSECAHVSIMM